MSGPQDASVRRDDGRHAYVLSVGGEDVGVAMFREQGDQIVFTHTAVDPDHEGEHLGSVLAKAALDDARTRGEQVVPQCPFIAAYIDRHPDYQDLLAR